jgi:hypothetical protein
MMKNIGLMVATVWLLGGCTGIQPQKEESAFIVMKTPTMKYADMGFIYNTPSTVKVEIYATGQPLVRLEINAMNICTSFFECLEKKKFNKKMLNEAYPPTLLENIFRGEPIFNKKGLTQTTEGFTQIIQKEGLYDISYSVVRGGRTFRDTINNILIKVREK